MFYVLTIVHMFGVCKYFLINIYEQLTNYRIANAKKLLRSGKSVTEACYECGFTPLENYFISTVQALSQPLQSVRQTVHKNQQSYSIPERKTAAAHTC